MSATNSTTNYALPIFIGTDKPAWLVDWNSAMTAIDAAIKGVDTDVQGAIVDISGLSSTVASHTSSIATISGQITVINTNLNTATGNINTINSLIGNGTPTTTDQTLIGAINELHANQGDLADLTTPAASLVAAINAISSGGAVAASAVSFDNTGTSIAATNVQAAIVELAQGSGTTPAASAVSYDNTASGLAATNVQGAIDELAQATEPNNLGTIVDISSYTGTNFYVVPSDGIIQIAIGYDTPGDVNANVYGANATDTNDTHFAMIATSASNHSASSEINVRKGMKVVVSAGNGAKRFIPFV